jgi:histidinol-phosphate aminotransferase
MQTLSKAFGLAGIRLGMALGNAEIIHYFNTVKAPYNVSKLASEMGSNAFKNVHVMKSNVALLLGERERVAATLKANPLVKRVCHSDANFLLFEVPNAHAIYKSMADGGVVARFRGNELHCTDCIRVTIGTIAENDAFLALFEKTASELNKSP